MQIKKQNLGSELQFIDGELVIRKAPVSIPNTKIKRQSTKDQEQNL